MSASHLWMRLVPSSTWLQGPSLPLSAWGVAIRKHPVLKGTPCSKAPQPPEAWGICLWCHQPSGCLWCFVSEAKATTLTLLDNWETSSLGYIYCLRFLSLFPWNYSVPGSKTLPSRKGHGQVKKMPWMDSGWDKKARAVGKSTVHQGHWSTEQILGVLNSTLSDCFT